ncbi:MAG: ABC transporter ATP-binding protein [Planctomycetota bacterium]|nr:ABC transporter ATP-binding protein [Planctomycetota bacterium]
MTLLQLDAVTKRFEAVDGASEGPEVLRGVDLTLEHGQRLAVVGPSGSGKSTLLHLIAGLDRPTSGKIRIDGTDVTALDEKGLAKLRQDTIGLVFQDHHLLPQCSALENVLVPTLVTDRRGKSEERARELLERVGLGERLEHRPAQLSGGERQRVAVVRALINKPSLLLADEPTGALDGDSAGELSSLLLDLNESEGVALIVVTHSDALAERVGNILRLEAGALAQSAP